MIQTLIHPLILLLVSFAFCEVFLNEQFSNWESRWVASKKDGLGQFTSTKGEFSGDHSKSGVKTSQDAKFYAMSSAFKKFSNTDKDLVVQMTVKFEQGIDCGGGYIKLLPKFDQTDFEGSTKYNMMFGPDICGSTKKVHLIFHHKGKNLDMKKSVECPSDKLSHVYTAVVLKDGTYELLIDGVKKESGRLLDDWDFTVPKTIPDPNAKKPSDWVDVAEIVDPNDKKPEDWDKPKTIPDPNAKKPEDWNEEEDGKWEPAQISNPEYRGEFSPRMIPNPEYKGEWKAPEVPNPEYKEDETVGKYDDFSVVGIDIWQVKSGTVYEDILLTSSVSTAEKERNHILERMKKEKEAFDKAEEKKNEEAKKAAEAPKKDDEIEKLAKEKADQLNKEAPTEKKDEL